MRASALPALLAVVLAGCASPLGRAAAAGDVTRVKKLIEAGAPLDAPDSDARTPLMRAAEADQADAVTALCDAGADPNASTRAGTPLETAARYGRLPAAKALLACGARPTARAQQVAADAGYPAVAAAIGEAVAPEAGDGDADPRRLAPGRTLSHGNLDPDALQRMLDASERSKKGD